MGCDRTLLTLLVDAYEEEGERVVLKLSPKLAPTKVAIFPLVNKDGMPEAAEKIYRLAQKKFKAFYDTSGAIGRRYRRQDEAGTPFCLTIDSETIQNDTVTLRERDSMQQERLSVEAALAKIKQATRF